MNDYLAHQSKYGSFIKIGNRSNNSSEYNRNYYLQNKDKWSKKNALGSALKKKNPISNLLDKWRNKAIDSISGFMVDLSVAYINKLLQDDRIANMKLDEIVYDKFSPVVNKMVDDAVDRATKKATQNINDAVNTAVNNAKSSATKEAESAASTVTDWLKKKTR